jgi:hypothetical protein
MFQTWESQLGATIMAVVCLFTAWAGGRPQRWAALAVALAWVGSSALQDRRNIDPQYAIFALDLVMVGAFGWMALTWRRSWLMAVTAFQLLTVSTHLATMMDSRIWPLAYQTAYLFWSYALLASIAWGGVEGWLDRRRTASDR